MKILFSGDFSASGVFRKKILSGESLFDSQILTIFKNSDFVHINLENPITDANVRVKKGVSLRAPPNTGEYLKKCGITVCDLANNHIMDCDIQGLTDTFFYLSRSEIFYYGIGNVAECTLLNKEDLKVILLSSCHKEGPVWNGTSIAPLNMDINSIKLLIAQIKKSHNPDYIIYNYHGGTEFNIIPEPRRRIFFHKLVQECDIDIVIGHHAHVPQGFEWIENKLIIFGLGNLCFDLEYVNENSYSDISYFVELTLERDHRINFKQSLYKIDREKQMVRLISNPSIITPFFHRLQVFDSDTKYRDAWENECFRIYFKNGMLDSSTSVISLSGSNNVIDSHLPIGKIMARMVKKYGFSLLPRMIRAGYFELKAPCRRPFMLGTLKYVFKQGIKL